MLHHAIEITLTRPATIIEFAGAIHEMPLAVNDDSTRFMALPRAETPSHAIEHLRQALDDRLPIDTLNTHYPDTDNQVLLNVAFAPEAHARIQHAAAQLGQAPEIYLRHTLRDTLARDAQQRDARLDAAMQELLAGATPGQLLGAAVRTFAQHHPAHPPIPPTTP